MNSYTFTLSSSMDNITVEDILMFALDHQMFNAVKSCFAKLSIGALELGPVCQTRLVICTLPKVLGVGEAALLVSGAQLVAISQILRGVKFIRNNCATAGGVTEFCFCVVKLAKVVIMHAVCTDTNHETILLQLNELFGPNSAQDLVKPDQDNRLVSVLKREISKFRTLVQKILEKEDARIEYIQGTMWDDFNSEFWKTLQQDLVSYLGVIKDFLPGLKLEKVLDEKSNQNISGLLFELSQKMADDEITEHDIIELLNEITDQGGKIDKENVKFYNSHSEELASKEYSFDYSNLHANSAPDFPISESKLKKNSKKNISPLKSNKRKAFSPAVNIRAAKRSKWMTVSEAVSLVLSDSESWLDFSQNSQTVADNSSESTPLASPNYSSSSSIKPHHPTPVLPQFQNQRLTRSSTKLENTSLKPTHDIIIAKNLNKKDQKDKTSNSIQLRSHQFHASEAHDVKLYKCDGFKPNNDSRKRIFRSDSEQILSTSSPTPVDCQPSAAKRRCAEQDVAVSTLDISDGQIFPLDDSGSSANNESIHSSFKACTGNVSSPKVGKQQFTDQIWSSSPILREKSPTAVKDTPGDHFLIRKWLNSHSIGPNAEKSTTTFYRQSPRRKLNYGVLAKIEQRFASISPTVNLERLKNLHDNEVESAVSTDEDQNNSDDEIVDESDCDSSVDLDWNSGIPDLRKHDCEFESSSPQSCCVMLERLHPSVLHKFI